jgi:hypothetical protein
LAHELYAQGLSKAAIANQLSIRKPTIIAWLAQKEYEDNRGWTKNKFRTHTPTESQRIVNLKKARINGKQYFLGSAYIQMDYSKAYPQEPLPSLWFMDETVRQAGLQTHEPKKRKKGQDIVSRLLFPIKNIVHLGLIQQSCDFIGKKYIQGSGEPIHVFSTSFYQWFELYQIRRVLTETAEMAIQSLTAFWEKFPLPHVLREDNGMTFRGTGRTSGSIGQFVKFLLNLNITPLFSAPYQSYTNPHIEGHNRTFGDKLWSKHHFTTPNAIDMECDRFNAESREFFEWKFKERLKATNLRHLNSKSILDSTHLHSTQGKKICFIRFVERWKETNQTSGIVILNRFVEISPVYLNQYVFVTLDLETSRLKVVSESQGKTYFIMNQIFEYTL